MSHIFIAYSRKDIDVAQKIIDRLAAYNLDTWIDWKSIPKGEDWEQEIYRGIEEADAFLFLISLDSVQSEMCNKEIAHAVKNGKRILPIFIADDKTSDTYSVMKGFIDQGARTEVSRRNFIFFRESQDDFNKAIEEIQLTIHTDYEWLKFHTSLQVKALVWERNDRNNGFLLRGKVLQEAEQQLTVAGYREPQPTDLQRIYVLESQRFNIRQRRNIYIPLILTVLLILSMGGYIAYLSQQLTLLKSELRLLSQTGRSNPTLVITAVIPTITTIPTQQPTITVTAVSISPVASTSVPTDQPNEFVEVVRESRNNLLTSIVVAVGGLFTAFGVLFLSASRLGTTIFSRSWLRKGATRFSEAFPGLFKRVIFIGYRERILSYREIDTVKGNEYFGLPAIDSSGNNIFPDKDGHILDSAIVSVLEPRKPVIVTGNGGAGKSTLLARWVFLSLNNQLSPRLNGFLPILITPPYFDGNLLEAITVVLRERDRVGVNTSDVHAQLETGKFLILFDGISEIEGDYEKGFQDILRIAKNAEYENCRFLLTSRPGITIPSDLPVFQLQPLTAEVIKGILPRYQLGREKEYQIAQQLDRLEMNTIEPLLFSMILAQAEGIQYSTTRSQLYERYFRRLLKIDSDNSTWNGWKMALELLAKWFTLETGRRGIGIPHERLVSQIEDAMLPQRLEKHYHLVIKDGWEMLMRLNAAGLLTEGRRWRFRHDTFEEYFAANYIISQLVTNEDFPNVSWSKVLPEISAWSENDEKQRSFLNILMFIREIANDKSENDGKGVKNIMLEANLPALWKATMQPNLENK